MPCPQCNSKKIVKNGRTDWIWLAIDATTPEILGVYIGDRDRANQQMNPKISLSPKSITNALSSIFKTEE
jgi:hypothetical protein